MSDPHTTFKSREQIIAMLPALMEKGYRYMARDMKSVHLSLYSCKPKRYEVWWGYTDKDLNNDNAIMAYPVKNNDITEINWSRRSPVLISKWLKDQE